MSTVFLVLLLGSAGFCLLSVSLYSRSVAGPLALPGGVAAEFLPVATVSPAAGTWRAVRWAFALRLVLGAALLYAGVVELFAGDAVFYTETGRDLARYIQADGRDLLSAFAYRPTGQGRYLAVNAIVHGLFGAGSAVMLVLTAAAGAWTVLLAGRIAHRLAGPQAAVRAAWLVCLFPSLVLWSSLNLRDPFIILATTGSVWATIRLKDEIRIAPLLQMVAWLALIAFLRGYMFGIVIAGTAVAFLLGSERNTLRNAIFAVIVAGAAVVAIERGGLADFNVADASLERLQTVREGFTWGANSAYLTEADLSSVEGVTAFLPLGILYFLFAPFPWMVRGGTQLLTSPEMIFWYCMIPYVVAGIGLAWKRNRTGLWALLAVAILTTLTYALISGNVGTAYRHRAQVLPLFLVLAGIGWAQAKARRAAAQ